MAKTLTAEGHPAEFIEAWLEEGIGVMQKYKPNDRSPKDRRWAIAITETEKVLAYWKTYCKEE